MVHLRRDAIAERAPFEARPDVRISSIAVAAVVGRRRAGGGDDVQHRVGREVFDRRVDEDLEGAGDGRAVVVVVPPEVHLRPDRVGVDRGVDVVEEDSRRSAAAAVVVPRGDVVPGRPRWRRRASSARRGRGRRRRRRQNSHLDEIVDCAARVVHHGVVVQIVVDFCDSAEDLAGDLLAPHVAMPKRRRRAGRHDQGRRAERRGDESRNRNGGNDDGWGRAYRDGYMSERERCEKGAGGGGVGAESMRPTGGQHPPTNPRESRGYHRRRPGGNARVGVDTPASLPSPPLPSHPQNDEHPDPDPPLPRPSPHPHPPRNKAMPRMSIIRGRRKAQAAATSKHQTTHRVGDAHLREHVQPRIVLVLIPAPEIPIRR